MLFFLLLPTFLAPISSVFSAGLVDYRKVWIVYELFEWTCSIGLVYAFLSAAFSELVGLRILLRRTWTVALLLGIGTAILLTQLETPERPYSLHGLTMNIFGIANAVATLVGFFVAFLVGAVFYFSVRIPENVAKLSVGTAIIFAVRTFGQPALLWGKDGEVVLRIHDVETVVWIGCLAYWSLFLSSLGERSTLRFGK